MHLAHFQGEVWGLPGLPATWNNPDFTNKSLFQKNEIFQVDLYYCYQWASQFSLQYWRSWQKCHTDSDYGAFVINLYPLSRIFFSLYLYFRQRYGNTDMQKCGNPENQIVDLQVFERPKQEFEVRFDFQGYHLFVSFKISSHMGTLNMKIFLKYQKNILKNHTPFKFGHSCLRTWV